VLPTVTIAASPSITPPAAKARPISPVLKADGFTRNAAHIKVRRTTAIKVTSNKTDCIICPFRKKYLRYSDPLRTHLSSGIL
jgi:hypothetical protein